MQKPALHGRFFYSLFLFKHLRLQQQRIHSIDSFRGITIFTMVFVNELASIKNIPGWMKHMPADADAMTFVDVVFPAFLFAAGMSIPFALKNRLASAGSSWRLQLHIAWRTIGLLTLGFFMVNGEEYDSKHALLPYHWWMLLFYTGAILTWTVYRFKERWKTWFFRGPGMLMLIALAFLYRGMGEQQYMQPRWWGILGLIGWAYLYSTIIYQLGRKRIAGLITGIILCTGFFVLTKSYLSEEFESISWLSGQAGNATHTAIMLCGVLLSCIFFRADQLTVRKKYLSAFILAIVLFGIGYLLRPAFGISKIYATPSWGLYSAGCCSLLYIFLHWLMDDKRIIRWANFLAPAAVNPLLTYLIPGILFSFFSLTRLTIWPPSWRSGWAGIIWSLLFSIIVLFIARALQRAKIRLQL